MMRDIARVMANTTVQIVPEKSSALSKIPAFPPVAIRVLNLLTDEDAVEIKKLLDLLVVDPAFSAEILRAANSPLFGFVSRIDSVQHALVILGLDRIKAATLTVATRFYLRGVSNVEMLRRCWRYSLATAMIADEVARSCGIFQDKAYTAALLHDVGRVGLLMAYSKEYGDLLEEASVTLGRGEPFDLLANERRLFGIDHCEAGRLLAQKWNLPVEFSTIAGYDEDFPPDEEFDLLALVRIACALTNSLGFSVLQSPHTPGFDEVLQRLPEPARHRFNPNPEELREAILAKIESFDIDGFGEKPAGSTMREAARVTDQGCGTHLTKHEQPESQPIAELLSPIPASSPEPESPALAAIAPEASRRDTINDVAVFTLGTVLFAAFFSFVLFHLMAK
jgi:HD-like signal output (HDOD) protein